MTLLSEIYDVTLKRTNRNASKSGFVRPTIGECFVTHKDFQFVENKTLHVGTGFEHTTINSAVNAAEDGYKIMIHPGTYVERVVVDKGLLFKGVPDENLNFPTINPPDTEANKGAFVFTNYSGEVSPILEGLTIYKGYEWAPTVYLTTGFYGTVRINRCYLHSNTICYPLGRGTVHTGTSCNFEVTNTYFGRCYSRVVRLIGGTDVITKSTYGDIAHTYGEVWREYICTGTVAINGVDVVKESDNIPGFGPTQGEWLLQ